MTIAFWVTDFSLSLELYVSECYAYFLVSTLANKIKNHIYCYLKLKLFSFYVSEIEDVQIEMLKVLLCHTDLTDVSINSRKALSLGILILLKTYNHLTCLSSIKTPDCHENKFILLQWSSANKITLEAKCVLVNKSVLKASPKFTGMKSLKQKLSDLNCRLALISIDPNSKTLYTLITVPGLVEFRSLVCFEKAHSKNVSYSKLIIQYSPVIW